MEITIATYNIHRGVGIDGKLDLERIVDVLFEMDCDIVGIQEIDSHAILEDGHQLNYLAKRTGYRVVAGPTLVRPDTEYGNALLTRYPIRVLRRMDLSFGIHEPRGAIDVDVDVHGTHLRIITTHLGLKFRERRQQLSRLFQGVDLSEAPLVIMGDMNEWIPLMGATRIFRENFSYFSNLFSYPSYFPIFGLDQVYVSPRTSLVNCEVHKSPVARWASDHLPVKATLRFSSPFGNKVS
jgi:endonuclease/exonuclease/phosphatase family metal-dependent hydrolase